jgi:hypothetical protein
MSYLSQFPAYSHIQNSLQQGPSLNGRKNIIAGPKPGDYWDHSRGLETPEYREEGPFPIQGNIGSLIKQEGNGNWSNCGNNVSIGGGPNCTGVFNSDFYTTSNTCGENCTIGAPEAFGIQSFGMDNRDNLTNIHGLHAYQNVRAAVEGRGPSDKYGCYEWVPNLQKTPGNSCQLNYTPFEAVTTGDFTKLSNWQNFANYTYTE